MEPRLFKGDAIEVMASLPDGSINLVLADLPYGTTNNQWDSVIPLEELWIQVRRLLAPRGCVVLTSQGIFTAKLILSNQEWFKYKLVWEKSKATNFLNAKRQPLRKHEDICVFYPSPPTYNPQMSQGEAYNKGVRKDQTTGSYNDFKPSLVQSEGQRYPTDVIYFPTAESEGKVWHPTQKPVALGQYLVRTYSNPGDTVLDMACGSGSFVVAAIAEQRNAIGIELYPEAQTPRGEPVNLLRLIRSRCAPYLETNSET